MRFWQCVSSCPNTLQSRLVGIRYITTDHSSNRIDDALISSSSNAARTSVSILFCYGLFFVSGAAGLMLELTWSRQIQLQLGHTNQASALVLASYFVGLGIGGLVAGRFRRKLKALFAYGVAEMLVGIWSLCIPFVVEFHSELFAGQWLKTACFVTLLPATIAMGATLPLIVEHLSSIGAHHTNVSRIYGINTFGAVSGLAAAITILLVNVGVSNTGFLAAILCCSCALAAFAKAGRPTVAAKATGQISEAPEDSPGGGAATLSWHLLVIAGFGGGMILIVEVMYLQLFSLVFHNSTYTFGLVLCVFLLALAVGAWIQPRVSAAYSSGLVMAYCPAVGSVLILVSVCVFVRLTGLEYFEAGATHAGYLSAAFVLVSAVVLCPVVVLGMLLPAVWAEGSRVGSRNSEVVATTSAVNCLSAAAGAVGAAFVLLPYLGLWVSFAAVSICGCLVSMFMLVGRRHSMSAAVLGMLTLLLASVIGISPGAERWAAPTDEVLIKRWNSSYGFIDVVRETKTGDLKLRQNLHYRHGSTGQNAIRIRRMGHLPLLLHSEPSQVAFVGLGTGITASAAVAHKQVESIDIVELIPEVVSAARILADANANVLVDSRTTIHINDARHFLNNTDRKFDVIVSDLFVPWESETGYLYSVQHLESARRRLSSNGLYCQWIPLYQLGASEFELIAHTFASVFPNTTLWWGNLQSNRAVIALVGSEEMLQVNIEQLDRRIERLTRGGTTTDSALKDGLDLHGRFAGAWENHAGQPLNTDEFPRVEFRSPASHRNKALLQKDALTGYFSQVFQKLPAMGVRFDSGGVQLPSVSELRNQHGFLLAR